MCKYVILFIYKYMFLGEPNNLQIFSLSASIYTLITQIYNYPLSILSIINYQLLTINIYLTLINLMPNKVFFKY